MINDEAKDQDRVKKAVVLVFLDHYLPGYKGGGPIRTIENMVSHLSNEFDFNIVTRDRDLGDDKPYLGIVPNSWQQVGGAVVHYVSPQNNSLGYLSTLIEHTPYDIVYLNSFFDTLTIRFLVLRKTGRIPSRPVIVAPRGEFAWASLRQKYLKKIAFIKTERLVGLYRNVIWKASSQGEVRDIAYVMKLDPDSVKVVKELPPPTMLDRREDIPRSLPPDNEKGLSIVFLSRISREKNLDFALRVLKEVKSSVTFDIYGPPENVQYWKECKNLFQEMPGNIDVEYRGIARHDDVSDIFARYDLFFFPTGGENYGHVIAESLLAGTPVLTSDRTPWRDLPEIGLGWDLALEDKHAFVEVIEKLAQTEPRQRLETRQHIIGEIRKKLIESGALLGYRRLLSNCLTTTRCST